MKTHQISKEAVERRWYVVDAEGKTLGRLATQVARVLRGKHKPTYSTYVDNGDFVIIVNAEKVQVTGAKLETKRYYNYSGHMGGLRSVLLSEQLRSHPDRVLRHAVRGMLPKNRLGRQMVEKLKVYAGPKHPHAAQKPELLEL
ncbi:MAG: 50S ribosomal protein L13 [Chloroflexi bacterium ADurb.Bin180]|nr:MAG: 50S ribosomal protein L13 [Chloroflexi bacterium ADurb.Bin180]